MTTHPCTISLCLCCSQSPNRNVEICSLFCSPLCTVAQHHRMPLPLCTVPFRKGTQFCLRCHWVSVSTGPCLRGSLHVLANRVRSVVNPSVTGHLTTGILEKLPQ